MTNTCKKCGEIVIPDPNDGHCPNCGAKDGYTVSSTLTFQHKIENGIEKYNKQIKRLKEIQEIYKGTKVEENLEPEIEKFKKIIFELEELLSKKYDKENIQSDEIKFNDDVIVEKFVEKKPETKSKTFTADTILTKADDTIKEGDKLIDTTNGDILRELKESRLENNILHSKNTKIAILGLLGTFGGLFLGLFGGHFIKPIQINFVGETITPIINATNMTEIISPVNITNTMIVATNSTIIP